MDTENSVRESIVEKYLVRRLKDLSSKYPYLAVAPIVKKISGPGWRGWTDRIALFGGDVRDRGGVTHWLEVKRPKGGRFEPLQLRNHRELRKRGFVVRVVNTKALVDSYIDEIVRLGPSGLPVGEEVCLKPPKSSGRNGTTATSRVTSARRTISSPTSRASAVSSGRRKATSPRP